eukprot:SM000187S03887  [mRNA]  locus=s187:94625:97336:+ [translate_table: standard]
MAPPLACRRALPRRGTALAAAECLRRFEPRLRRALCLSAEPRTVARASWTAAAPAEAAATAAEVAATAASGPLGGLEAAVALQAERLPAAMAASTAAAAADPTPELQAAASHAAAFRTAPEALPTAGDGTDGNSAAELSSPDDPNPSMTDTRGASAEEPRGRPRQQWKSSKSNDVISMLARGMIDDAAVEEDEDGNDVASSEDEDEDDGGGSDEELGGAASEEDEMAAQVQEAQRKREEVHQQWLERQDSAAIDGMLHQIRTGFRSRRHRGDPGAGVRALLAEEAEQGTLVKRQRLARAELPAVQESGGETEDTTSKAESCGAAGEAGVVGDEKSSGALNADDDQDDDDNEQEEEVEELLLRHQTLLESEEEQAVFLSPAEDESSQEVLGLLARANSRPPKGQQLPASGCTQRPTALRCFGMHLASNSSHQLSFVGRCSSSSSSGPAAVSLLRSGSSSQRSFVFAREHSSSFNSSPRLDEDGGSSLSTQLSKGDEVVIEGGKAQLTKKAASSCTTMPKKRPPSASSSSLEYVVAANKARLSLFGMLRGDVISIASGSGTGHGRALEEASFSEGISAFAAFRPARAAQKQPS